MLGFTLMRRHALHWLLAAFWTAGRTSSAWAAHGYALWNDLKYPPGFAHFEYVNPQAPKGGELRLVSGVLGSTFDKYNPFTVKGQSPAYAAEILFESLLGSSLDETASGYGLLAREVIVAPDRLSVVFKLRPEARFHNGKPVLAQDVKHSYETLIGPYAKPAYQSALVDVAGLDVLDDLAVRFRFKKPNRELPLMVGALPVFSRDWGTVDGKGKPFDQIVTDVPIGSGAYKIGSVGFGKDITYVRDPNYWGRHLNVKVGSGNFDRITIKIYKDRTSRLEAIKVGEIDLMGVYSAGDWARRMNGKRFNTGELVKAEFSHRLPSGLQSFFLNTRRPLLADVRVRQALGLALDFEWMNRQLFYNAYQRNKGLFGNTVCQATGTPSPQELALLEPWRAHLPSAVWGEMADPPRTDGKDGLRGNLIKARALLEQAGWTIQNGVLRDTKGKAFELEILDEDAALVRIVTPWARNLEKLGVVLRFRSVDDSLYHQRLQKFDFDIVSLNFSGTHNPGQELAQLFGSAVADQEGSDNYPGVKNPAVDAMIQTITQAPTKEALLPGCHALDRIIAHKHYLIPLWSSPTHPTVYNAKRLGVPKVVPPYLTGETWAMSLWWAK